MFPCWYGNILSEIFYRSLPTMCGKYTIDKFKCKSQSFKLCGQHPINQLITDIEKRGILSLS